MTSPNSPIIEYYPLDFKTDLNGKQQEWEAVVLIPFIDEVCTHTHTHTQWTWGHKSNLLTCLSVCEKDVPFSSYGAFQFQTDEGREGQEPALRVWHVLLRPRHGLHIRLLPAAALPKHRPLSCQVHLHILSLQFLKRPQLNTFWGCSENVYPVTWSFFNCSREVLIPLDAWHVPSDHVSKRVDRSTLYFCGFPTLHHIKHKVGEPVDV